MNILSATTTMVLGLFLSGADTCQGQGTVFLSNLDEPSAGSVIVGSNSWIAVPFIAGNGPGPGGYWLASVDILLDSPAGNPFDLTVSIHLSSRAGVPAATGWSLGSQSPGSSGVVNFSASNIVLSDLTRYWVVVTGGNATPADSYSWSRSSTDEYGSSEGWLLGDYYSSPDGLAWTRVNNTFVQLAVSAIPIPEPPSWALLGLGGLCLGMVACRRRAAGGGRIELNRRQG